MENSLQRIVNDLAVSVSKTGQMHTSFSQLGEDRILSWIFGARRDGFYVDVGCHHPYRYSNTALLHIVNGWHGVNVDVDERAIVAFQEHRPNDSNVQAAVGGMTGQVEVTFFQTGEINTLDPVMAANPAWTDLVKERRLVNVFPLRDILRTHVPSGQKIDFLNIDIEGMDYAALQSNDWDLFAPEVIAVEVHGFDAERPADSPTFQLLKSKGYRLLAHLVVTSIYRRESF